MKHPPHSAAEAVAAFLREQSGWREAQVLRFPGDDRNRRSAEALGELAAHVAALPDDDPALQELVNAGGFDARGAFVATDEARRVAARFGFDWITTPPVLLQELARTTWRARRPAAQKRTRMNATIATEHVLTESDKSTLGDIFVLAESHSRRCFDAERAYHAAFEAADHFASDHRAEWISTITDVHAAISSAALARVRALGGIDLDGKLLTLEGDELERFLRPLFVEAGIEEDFLRDRTTYADFAPTLSLRRDIAGSVGEALKQIRLMERVQSTPVHIARLEEMIANARDSADAIQAYVPRLEDALRCVRALANGGNPTELLGRITSALKTILENVVPEDRIDSGTMWERSQALRGVLEAANRSDEWAADVLKARPHLAFYDELTKKWVEQIDTGQRSSGISAQRDRNIRTRPPEQ
jgi:hypothetical protein